MNEATPRVLDLLTYIEQVEKLKRKPAFAVPTEFFVAYQHELKGLPEMQFNLQTEGDDVWLRVPLLREILAPELDEKLKPWVALPKSPEKAPELKTEAVTCDGKLEVVWPPEPTCMNLAGLKLRRGFRRLHRVCGRFWDRTRRASDIYLIL